MPAQLMIPEPRETRIRHDRSYDVRRDHDAQTSGGNVIAQHEIVSEMGCKRLEAADCGEDRRAYRVRRA